MDSDEPLTVIVRVGANGVNTTTLCYSLGPNQQKEDILTSLDRQLTGKVMFGIRFTLGDVLVVVLQARSLSQYNPVISIVSSLLGVPSKQYLEPQRPMTGDNPVCHIIAIEVGEMSSYCYRCYDVTYDELCKIAVDIREVWARRGDISGCYFLSGYAVICGHPINAVGARFSVDITSIWPLLGVLGQAATELRTIGQAGRPDSYTSLGPPQVVIVCSDQNTDRRRYGASPTDAYAISLSNAAAKGVDVPKTLSHCLNVSQHLWFRAAGYPPVYVTRDAIPNRRDFHKFFDPNIFVIMVHPRHERCLNGQIVYQVCVDTYEPRRFQCCASDGPLPRDLVTGVFGRHTSMNGVHCYNIVLGNTWYLLSSGQKESWHSHDWCQQVGTMANDYARWGCIPKFDDVALYNRHKAQVMAEARKVVAVASMSVAAYNMSNFN